MAGLWRSRPPLWLVLVIASHDGALLSDGDAFAVRDLPRAEARVSRAGRLAWLDRAWDLGLFGLPPLAVLLMAAVLALAGAAPAVVLGLVVAAMIWVVLVLGAVLGRLVTALIRRRPVETAVEQLRAVNPTLTLLHAPTPAQATGLVARATAPGGPLLVLVDGITREHPGSVGPGGLRVDPLSDVHPVLVAHRPADPLPRAPSGPGRLHGRDLAVVLGGSAGLLAVVAAFLPGAEASVPGASITGYGDALYWMANRLLGGDPDGLGAGSVFGRLVGVLVTVYGLYVLVAIIGAVVRQRIADDQRSAADVVAAYTELRAAGPYPQSEPHASGMLAVGGGQGVFWQSCGNPDGAPAVVLHGGPGSGAARSWTGLLDPAAYRIVLLDQRGCGRSTPDAADPAVSLDTNTTSYLISDVEALRVHLGVERWLVLGASWGSTLALAYAQRHPRAVSAMVLFSVVGTTHREVEWVTRGMRRFLPREWARFRDAVPPAQRDGNLPDAYARLLGDRDPNVRERAAREWCAWEERHVAATTGPRPSPRFADPAFRMRFARLVTHYWRNAAWLGEDELVEGAAVLAGVPGVLIHGRGDVSSPPEFAHRVHQAWPGSELVLVDGAGHEADDDLIRAVIAATDRFR